MSKIYIVAILAVILCAGVALYTRPDFLSGLTQSEPAPSVPVTPAPQKTAANLLFNTENLPVSRGGNFSVDVILDTGENGVVALSAYVVFDAEKPEVLSVDSSDSAFSIKVEEEAGDGIIKITRGQPAPGVKGSSVKVAKVNFGAKTAGLAGIGFSLDALGNGPTRVILNDGKGTDILMSAASLNISIAE